MGLVAQEVEAVFPEWVGQDQEGLKTLSIRGFEALVIEALREIKQEMDAVKFTAAEVLSKLRTEAEDKKLAGKAAKSSSVKNLEGVDLRFDSASARDASCFLVGPATN
jgi:hypothetical protein